MIYNKGGKSHARNARRVALVAPRRRYSNREKALALCLVQEKMKDESISLARAACEINIPPSSIYRWRANANLPDLSTDSSDIAEKKQNHQGPEGFLDDIKDELSPAQQGVLLELPSADGEVAHRSRWPKG